MLCVQDRRLLPERPVEAQCDDVALPVGDLLEQRVFPDGRGDALAARGDHRLQPEGLVPPAAAVGV